MWADVTLQTDLIAKLKEEEAKIAERRGEEPEEFKYPTLIMVKPPRKKREEKFFSYVRLPADAEVSKDSV